MVWFFLGQRKAIINNGKTGMEGFSENKELRISSWSGQSKRLYNFVVISYNS
jgi:hypothetical protein